MNDEILKKLHKEEIEILDEFVRICNKYNLNYFLIGGTLLGAVRHSGYIPWDDDLDIAMPRKDYELFLKLASKELKENFILDYYTTNKNYCLAFAKIRNNKTEFIENFSQTLPGYKGIWLDIFPLDDAKNTGILLKIRAEVTRMVKRLLVIKCIQPKNEQKARTIVRIILKIFPKKTLSFLCKELMVVGNNENNKYYINLGSQYKIHRQTHLKEKCLPVTTLLFEGKEYNVPKDSDYVLTNIYGKSYMQLPPKDKRVTHAPIKIKFSDGEEIVFDEEI